LQQVTGALKDLGATICAITPQPPDASRPLIEKHKISFDVLSDHGNEYAAKLGLRFKLPDELKQVYLSFGNDLALRNGEDSWTLPLPAGSSSMPAVSSARLMSIPTIAIDRSPVRRWRMWRR